jgi:hypothetical protein
LNNPLSVSENSFRILKSNMPLKNSNLIWPDQ